MNEPCRRAVALTALLFGAGCAAATAPDAFYLEQPLARAAGAVDRAPPPIEPHSPIRLPRLTEATLESGMAVRIAARAGTGLVSLVYASRRARLDADYMSVFIGDALLAGAYQQDGKLRYPVGVEGNSPRVMTGSSGTVIVLTCRASSFTRAVELLADVVQRPAFDAAGLVSVRSRAKVDMLRFRHNHWDWLLAMAHGDLSFQPNVEEFASQMQALERPALLRAHSSYYAPEDSALIVVGDIAAEPALAAVQQHFSGWARPAAQSTSRGVPKAIAARAPSRAPAGRKIIVSEGDAYPSVVVIQDAPAIDSQDLMAFELMSRILSQGPGGLLQTLRLEQAHAYYVGARTLTVPERGRYLFVETKVGAETLAADVARVLDTLEQLRTTPVDAEALAGVKARAGAQLASVLASGQGLAHYLADEYLGETPALGATLERLDAVTPEEIQRVAARYLAPERATIGVAGKVSASLPELARLGELVTSADERKTAKSRARQ